jgi:hypothetical protein
VMTIGKLLPWQIWLYTGNHCCGLSNDATLDRRRKVPVRANCCRASVPSLGRPFFVALVARDSYGYGLKLVDPNVAPSGFSRNFPSRINITEIYVIAIIWKDGRVV